VRDAGRWRRHPARGHGDLGVRVDRPEREVAEWGPENSTVDRTSG
jgi:hypothetical protein